MRFRAVAQGITDSRLALGERVGVKPEPEDRLMSHVGDSSGAANHLGEHWIPLFSHVCHDGGNVLGGWLFNPLHPAAGIGLVSVLNADDFVV